MGFKKFGIILKIEEQRKKIALFHKRQKRDFFLLLLMPTIIGLLAYFLIDYGLILIIVVIIFTFQFFFINPDFYAYEFGFTSEKANLFGEMYDNLGFINREKTTKNDFVEVFIKPFSKTQKKIIFNCSLKNATYFLNELEQKYPEELSKLKIGKSKKFFCESKTEPIKTKQLEENLREYNRTKKSKDFMGSKKMDIEIFEATVVKALSEKPS